MTAAPTAVRARRAFTLVEMMVVLAMIMILSGALVSSVSGARERAKITAATVAANEITKAILMYENYAKTHDLSGVTMDKRESTRDNLAFILGEGETDSAGNRIPVLYNAAITGNAILDPWGNKYRVTIKADTANIAQNKTMENTRKSGIALPNFYRRRAGEPD